MAAGGSLVAFIALLYTNHRRLEAARTVLERAGPSEITTTLTYGFNERCSDIVSVAFWQRGPHMAERQGYVCGGAFGSARIEVVPFAKGAIAPDDA